MPVRLETRFKTINGPGAPAPLRQLWVRIYPDDCWIDSFDPALTETEFADTKSLLERRSGRPAASKIKNAGHGAVLPRATARDARPGSSQQFTPVNRAAKPTKPRAEDVILTIPTDAPLPSAEEAATLVFWRALGLPMAMLRKPRRRKKAFENVVGVGAGGEHRARLSAGEF